MELEERSLMFEELETAEEMNAFTDFCKGFYKGLVTTLAAVAAL